ncbi:reverse transcriptase domain-containing protein [Tanacetum coccineum]|uniref:Reverse transcriptase domain-containing protein n=1 Tax=Tanacetum coccineum TaxID=301880 RepID=A0ABQ5DF28_9ASTR
MEAQYGKFLDLIRAVRINVPLIDVLAGMPNYGNFLKELIRNKHKIKQISAAFLNDESSTMIQNKVPPKLRDPESFLIPCNFNKTFSCNALADLGASINLMPYSLYAKLSLETLKPTKMSVRLTDRSFQYPLGIAENMIVEDVIRVKQKQLNLRVGTERMIFNINSAMKHSYLNDDTCFSIDVIDEILEEDFDALLDEGSKILYSIEGTLLEEEIFVEFDEFMAMTANENSNSDSDIEDPPFEKITINPDYKIKTSLKEPPKDLELKPLPDNMEYVFLEEPSFLPVIISSQLSKEKKNKLISILKKHKQAFAWKTTDIPKWWIITVVNNKNDELVLTRTVTGWRVCIDYRKLNEATAKDHFPLPFMDQMLERLAGNKYFCFLDGFSGYFQIPIDPNDQEKTTFTCPFGTYAYRRMPFGLCNAPATFQRCMLAIFHDMIEESVKVFMDDFSVFGNSFDTCLNNLDKMLQRCKDAHNVLIGKMSTSWSRRNYFSKIARPLTKLLEKDTPFEFDDECQKAFESLKEKLTCAPVIVSPNWNLPFELMCDASDFAVGAILLLQELDIEIKDRKGTENVVADHLSRIENDEISNDSEVDDNFLRKTLMEINTEETYLFKVCSDGFYWPTIIKEAHTLVRLCEACQKTRNISKRDEMPLNNIQRPSGQDENMNRALKRILEKSIKDNPAIWSRKLDDALWAFRTAYKTPTDTTPYKLIYGKNCHLPFKIEHRAYWALKNCNPYLIVAGEKRTFQLHKLDELRYQAYENSRLYKERTKVWHDRKLRMRKEFKQGNKVLLFHSKYKFKQPKLRSRWLGPYVVKHQYPSGYVELYEKDGKTFIVNGHRLKLHHEEDNNSREAVTPFFPKE